MSSFNPYRSSADDDSDYGYNGGYEPRRKTNTNASTRSPKSKHGFQFGAAPASIFGKLSPFRGNKQNESFQDSSSDGWSDNEEERDAPDTHDLKTPQTKNSASVRQEGRSVDEYSVGAVSVAPCIVDPWEATPREIQDGDESGLNLSPRHAKDDNDVDIPANTAFIAPSDIHPNMISREEDIAQLRLLAGKLSADWKGQDFMAPALARRIRDFQFAQDKRRRKYGDERPWGILGLYDHLAAIRVDVEWAEDAAWRRANGEPYLSWADFDASKKQGLNGQFFTYFLLFTCSVTLIVSFALNGWSVEPLDVNPMIGPSANTLIKMGAKDSYLIVHDNEAWRLVSSTILHAGLVHYFINMLALWFVGSAIEQCHGTIATTILFVLPAIGGTILSAIFLPDYITVGASGGIFGLIGACLSDIVMNWKLLFCDFVTENGKKHRHVMVVVLLLLDVALNCVIGLTPYVDNFTHLGGMAYGFLCGLSTMERLSRDFFGIKQNCFSNAKQIIVRYFGLIVSVICILVATIILLEGDGTTNPCPKCTWLSCVPFPPWEGATNKWWYCDDCERITADIVKEPSLHLSLHCPDGTSATVGLDPDEEIDREKITRELPKYCREYCPNVD